MINGLVKRFTYPFIIMIGYAGITNAGYTYHGFQDKGYIRSGAGTKCWFTQEEDIRSSYFSDGGISGIVAVLTFDDSNCMSEDSAYGLGHIININIINTRISTWYSNGDGNFKTRENELYGGSAFQEKGVCMQSATYPIIGVSIDYILNMKGAIAAVYHGPSAGGCVTTDDEIIFASPEPMDILQEVDGIHFLSIDEKSRTLVIHQTKEYLWFTKLFDNLEKSKITDFTEVAVGVYDVDMTAITSHANSHSDIINGNKAIVIKLDKKGFKLFSHARETVLTNYISLYISDGEYFYNGDFLLDKEVFGAAKPKK
jgi:hypothetical protein